MSKSSCIYWPADKARLKTFSATARASGVALIKIEIEVVDPWMLGRLLEELGDIKRQQNATARAEAAAAKVAALGPPPLQLTYRGRK